MPPEKSREFCGQPVSLKFTALPGEQQTTRQKLGLDLAALHSDGHGEVVRELGAFLRLLGQSRKPCLKFNW